MSVNSAAIFIDRGDVVRGYRNQPAVGNLKLAMEFDQQFSLPAVLGAIASAAEYENHWIRALQFREFPTMGGVVT